MPPLDCPGMKLGLRTDPWISKNCNPGCVLFISLSAMHLRLRSCILFWFLGFFLSVSFSPDPFNGRGVCVGVNFSRTSANRFAFVWKAFIPFLCRSSIKTASMV